MPKDFIQITRNDSAAIFSADLLQLITSLRHSQELLQKVKSRMDHCWATSDFADLEARFGVPTGSGGAVYALVRDSQKAINGAATSDAIISLTEKVG